MSAEQTEPEVECAHNRLDWEVEDKTGGYVVCMDCSKIADFDIFVGNWLTDDEYDKSLYKGPLAGPPITDVADPAGGAS